MPWPGWLRWAILSAPLSIDCTSARYPSSRVPNSPRSRSGKSSPRWIKIQAHYILTLVAYRYEFYYDVLCRGQYTFEIKCMHQKYGPIVRINPCELHISQPDFYDEIYAGGGRRRDKWDWFANQFGIPESTFATVSHDKHRIRRSALNPFFSMGSVRRLQPMIEERLDAFLGRLSEFQASGEPMTISLGFAAFTNGWWARLLVLSPVPVC